MSVPLWPDYPRLAGFLGQNLRRDQLPHVVALHRAYDDVGCTAGAAGGTAECHGRGRGTVNVGDIVRDAAVLLDSRQRGVRLSGVARADHHLSEQDERRD